MMDFISKKLTNFVALGLFALLMFIVILLFPVPALTTPMSNLSGRIFSLLTDTAGKPGFLITAAVLSLSPMLMRLPKKTISKLWIQFAILLILSFGAKTILKHVTEIPRPYTHELQRLHLVPSAQDYYHLSYNEKENIIDKAALDVSPWRIHQWRNEVNYSFPSGHTIFAAVCVLFWGGFFLRHNKYLLASGLILWAIGVGTSRLWLGMHWPSDVMGSILSAAIIYFFIPEWNETKN